MDAWHRFCVSVVRKEACASFRFWSVTDELMFRTFPPFCLLVCLWDFLIGTSMPVSVLSTDSKTVRDCVCSSRVTQTQDNTSSKQATQQPAWPWRPRLLPKELFLAVLALRVTRRNKKHSRSPIIRTCRNDLLRRLVMKMPSCSNPAPTTTTTTTRCGNAVLCKSSNSRPWQNLLVPLIHPSQVWVFERRENQFPWIKLVRR